MKRALAAILAIALAAALAAGAGAQPSRPRTARPVSGEAHRGLTGDLDCSACHTAEGWRSGGGTGSGRTGFDHARTGFPLRGRHRDAPCTGCHRPDRRVVRECGGCHEDPHAGRLGIGCDGCHSASGWGRVRGIEVHRTTRLPLTGMHVLADCTECHRRQSERAFTGVPAECIACHASDYHRTDVHPNHDGTAGGAPFATQCGQCHTAMGWSPAFVDPTVLPRAAGLLAPPEHELRFPIRSGPHRGAACTSCHADAARLPMAVRCGGCHEHAPGRIRAQHRRPIPPGDGAACLACHVGGAVP